MIKIISYAKINIGLTILNKREDGYHNIETTLSTINLSDKLVIEKKRNRHRNCCTRFENST